MSIESTTSEASAKRTGNSQLTQSSVTQLEKKVGGLSVDSRTPIKGKKAHIWDWLMTPNISNPLPEDSEVTGSLAGQSLAGGTNQIPQASKVDISQLRRLGKKYPKYYRDLNAVSPNNW